MINKVNNKTNLSLQYKKDNSFLKNNNFLNNNRKNNSDYPPFKEFLNKSLQKLNQ